MHFYDTAVASAPGGPSLPGHYTVQMYRELQKQLGLDRVVVVQPNAYRHDHRVMLAAIAELDAGAKGVAAVAPDVTDAEIMQLTASGICAQRIFALPGGVVGFDRMDEIMVRAHSFGWHANIQLNGRDLPRHETQLARLPGHFVIDHIGRFMDPVPPQHEAFQSLLRLLDTARCWVKLSAPYESSKTGAPGYEDVSSLAIELVKRYPERLLWATNWPHPYRSPMPSSAAMLDRLSDWVPEAATRHRILVDNPAELYGFN